MIITGGRRCGKSFAPEQIRAELSEETDHFVYLDFDHRMDYSGSAAEHIRLIGFLQNESGI